MEGLDSVIAELGSHAFAALPLLRASYPVIQLRYLGADEDGTKGFHRRQLRKDIGVTYPDVISTDDLYERTGTEPLPYCLLEHRWTLLGQILRLSMTIPDLPTYRHMEAFFAPSQNLKFRGRNAPHFPLSSMPTSEPFPTTIASDELLTFTYCNATHKTRKRGDG